MTRASAHTDLHRAPTPPIEQAYDVVVVGARAAGASTAMLLARRGLTVLAVDRAGYGTDTLSTHALTLPGVLQLSRWGLLDDLRAAATPRVSTVVFHYGARTSTIEVPERGDVDGLYAPRRTLLDARLVDAAVAAGAHVRHGVAVRGLLRSDTGRVTGVELEVDGRARQVRASVVVGADGRRSRVASDVAAPLLHRDTAAAATIFSYFTGLPSDRIENHYDAERVVGVIPTNDGAAVVWAGMAPDRFAAIRPQDRAAAHAAQVRQVPALADALAGGERVDRFHSFPGAPAFLRQAWGPGWALVGDAGYFKDPVSSHGITDAFISAELLADSLVETLREGRDERNALEAYQRTRDELAAQMLPHVARAASLGGDMEAVEAAFKGMSQAMREEWRLIESQFGAPARAA